MEVRPEVLGPEAMKRGANAEKGDLTATCSRIFRLLQKAVADRQKACRHAVEKELPEHRRVDPAALRPFYDGFTIRDIRGVDLLRFAVNPRSFAQTIENMFCISSLIREGKVHFDFDDDGLPLIYESAGVVMPLECFALITNQVNLLLFSLLSAAEDGDEEELMERSSPTRHQAIKLDQARWKEVIEAFNVRVHYASQGRHGPLDNLTVAMTRSCAPL
ncbi:hypothetical protein RB597_005854 [Gaeumannomyces tritici]